MALARNLKPNKIPKLRHDPTKARDYKKLVIYGVIFVIIIFGLYGVVSLVRLAPKEEDKKEIVLETGDQPLPEEIKIWINAPGGLNMRSEANPKSEILKIIPNGTELTSSELSGDWYKVEYDGKVGWVHKDYIRYFKAEETKTLNSDWKNYNNPSFGYTVAYPADWVIKDYGSNDAASLLSYVGFGPQLANTLDPSNLPPIVIKVTSDSRSAVDEIYKKKIDSKSEPVTVSNLPGTKYIFTASSGVQMTAIVVTVKNNTIILEESGGYIDELTKMVEKFKV